MRYLLDTNIVSELRKGNRCDASVTACVNAELVDHGGAISVLTLGEIRKGINLIAIRDPHQASRLESWLSALISDFDNRVLKISSTVANEWGRLNAIRPLPAVDSLLAATALVYGLKFATRNVAELQGLGLPLVNPFEHGR